MVELTAELMAELTAELVEEAVAGLAALGRVAALEATELDGPLDESVAAFPYHKALMNKRSA